MTFLELLDITKNRIDETDQDDQIDVIIKSAINHAYMFDLSRIDKRVSSSIAPVINGFATLPDDLYSLITITPSLVAGEKKIGNIITSSRSINFTILYSSIPQAMVNDTDEPDLNIAYQYMLTTWACYSYFAYRKKNSVAQMFLAEYQNEKNSIFEEDSLEEITQDVISTSTGSDA